MMFNELLTAANEILINPVKSIDFKINKLTCSSKNIEQNDVFFAVKGFKTDGNKFVSDAFNSGAMAVISDAERQTADNRIINVSDVRKAMAVMSTAFYGNPSKKLKMIGVTGTNGKTTVTSIINYVLQKCGKVTGLIGTNGNCINNRFIKTEHTTPEAIELNALLKQMADEEVEYAVMEVSSHSLALQRVYGIEFDISVFTNLTPEHLDFHNDMESYFSAKKILFDTLKPISSKGIQTAAIYNCNDEYGEKIVLGSDAEKISYGIECGAYSASNIEMDINGMKFDVHLPDNHEKINKVTINTGLTGKFNVHNILASIAALHSLGINIKDIVNYIGEFDSVEGRFNKIKLNNGAVAIIDYSHTPDSLLKALTSIREILDESKSGGKIITVFGCGGNRDKKKRPVMGNIAVKYSNEAIITSDNPRNEDPMQIIEEIISGITSDNYSVEVNRELAIKKAVGLSKINDIILIAGKGHETYQEINGVKYHLSDKEIALKYGK